MPGSRYDEEEEQEDGQLEEGQEHEADGHHHYPVASCSYDSNATLNAIAGGSSSSRLIAPMLPTPPPPPTVLRLVIHHSTQNPSVNLLPSHQTLALLDGTTTVGRDKSYEPRIRLKTLEASRTHATFYQQEQEQQQDNIIAASENPWFIVDNASTHGTFIRRHGQSDYSRLSEKGQSSLPKQLKHME